MIRKIFFLVITYTDDGRTYGAIQSYVSLRTDYNPDNKVHGANLGPIWGRQDPGGSHVGPMNFAVWERLNCETLNYIMSLYILYIYIERGTYFRQQPALIANFCWPTTIGNFCWPAASKNIYTYIIYIQLRISAGRQANKTFAGYEQVEIIAP